MSSNALRALVVAAMCAVAISAAGRARADAPWLGVTRGPGATDCPDATALAAAVAREPHGGDGAALAMSHYNVAITRDAARLAATIRVSGANAGERTIVDRGDTCQGLARALAVTLAILLDEERRAREESVEAPVNPPPPQAPPQRDTAPPVRVPRSSERAVTIGARAGGGALLGVLPQPGAMGVVEATFGVGRWSLQAGAIGAPAVAARVGIGEVDVSAIAGRVSGCGGISSDPRALTAGICAVVAVGAVEGAAHGYDTNDTRTRAWVAAGSALFGAGPIASPLTWWGKAGFLVPIVPQGFDVRGVGPVFVPPAAGGSLEMGIGVTFR